MPVSPVEAVLAVMAAAAVSAMALRLGALDRGGAVAATLVGSSVLVFAGLAAAMILVAFFVSASALSALPGRAARARRGARQVLANGSVAAIAAALHPLHPLARIALLGAVAAATADTWGTEVGVRSGRQPRSILSLRPRPVGASGAVSVPGTLASVVGAAAVAALGALLVLGDARFAVAVAAGGIIGALADSLLGASVQARYVCPACGAVPEVPRHAGCPENAQRVGGAPGLDNDLVNLLATAVGAAAAVALSALF